MEFYSTLNGISFVLLVAMFDVVSTIPLVFPQGDSGAPLICEGIFRGVTAFGLPGKCGDPRGPGVYILLSKKHLNWIVNTMKHAV